MNLCFYPANQKYNFIMSHILKDYLVFSIIWDQINTIWIELKIRLCILCSSGVVIRSGSEQGTNLECQFIKTIPLKYDDKNCHLRGIWHLNNYGLNQFKCWKLCLWLNWPYSKIELLRQLFSKIFLCPTSFLENRPWWPSGLSHHVSNSSRDICLGPRFKIPL